MNNNQTPLFQAASLSQFEMAKFFIESGADINAKAEVC